MVKYNSECCTGLDWWYKCWYQRLFAGDPSNVVDIFDSSTNSWSTATLSVARYYFSATNVGNKALFAGGLALTTAINGDTCSCPSDAVDIFDNSTNSWSNATLSVARLYLSATSVGTKAFFAGGDTNSGPYNVVDIFDSSTNSWSTATLSVARYYLSATNVGTKALFAGGQINGDEVSDIVDIFDANSTPTSTPNSTQTPNPHSLPPTSTLTPTMPAPTATPKSTFTPQLHQHPLQFHCIACQMK